MEVKLRPYQLEAGNAILREWYEEHIQRTLLVLPTGTGKTIVFAKLTEYLVRKGLRVLILAHRDELLQQARTKLETAADIECSLEKADSTALGESFSVTVGSVQTLGRNSRLERFPQNFYDVIIIDEAHHALSETYQRILRYFDKAKVLGVTATPDRGDKKILLDLVQDNLIHFNSIAYEYTLPQAIKDGYLCNIIFQTAQLEIDLGKVKTSQGDYDLGDLGDTLDTYLEKIADEMKKICQNRKTVVFLPLIDTAIKFRNILNCKGFTAAEVDGSSPDRAEILADFDSGKYNVLCNAMLLTEGWDCPSVDCVVILRPTKIRSLYCQMVGRGTRLSPGKTELLLLDFLWLTAKHNLCRPADLVGTTPEVKEKFTDEGELLESLERAEKDAKDERENNLKKQLEEERRKSKKVNFLDIQEVLELLGLADYQPMCQWEISPATDKQKNALSKFGMNSDLIDGKGLAAKCLDVLFRRSKEHLATLKQVRLLKSKGFQNVIEWTFDDANSMISQIANNHWQVPYGINPETYVPTQTAQMNDNEEWW